MPNFIAKIVHQIEPKITFKSISYTKNVFHRQAALASLTNLVFIVGRAFRYKMVNRYLT